jgi:hypothetical protein
MALKYNAMRFLCSFAVLMSISFKFLLTIYSDYPDSPLLSFLLLLLLFSSPPSPPSSSSLPSSFPPRGSNVPPMVRVPRPSVRLSQPLPLHTALAPLPGAPGLRVQTRWCVRYASRLHLESLESYYCQINLLPFLTETAPP